MPDGRIDLRELWEALKFFVVTSGCILFLLYYLVHVGWFLRDIWR